MSQHQAPVRPLAPAAASDSSRDSSFNGRNQSDPSFAQSGQGSSKRNASIACLNCKSAKRKCDQGVPCANCRNTDKECVYDASQDGRRKEVRKRRLDELEFRSNALDRLLLKLRNSSHAEARELIDLIKRDAPLEDILEFIEKNPGELADETRRALSASPPPPEGAGIRRMLAISELIDMPTFQVEAAPWTKVTSDNAFVSNVLSAYYNWYHFHYLNFDWELFIEAFKAKDLDSPYCSPLLVNVVLGMGCMFSDHPSALAVSGDSETRGQQFYNEAQRLYELEGDRLTLANVQGFTILIMLAAFSGKDRVSSAYLKKLEVIVPELLSQYATSNSEQPISPELQRSLAIIDWAAYIYLTGFGISFMASPTWSKPTLERPYESDSWKSYLTPWSPYPLNQEPIKLPQQALCDDLSVAYSFMGDVQSLLFGEFPKLNALQKYEAAQELDSRNQIWYDSLPAAHRFDQPSFIIVPATVDLALAILFARLFLWNWTTPLPSATRSSPQEEARYEPDPTEDGRTESEKLEEVRALTLATCSQIVETIVSIACRFDDQYGPTYHSMLMPQSCIYCANFLLSGNLYSAHEEEQLLQIVQILVQSSKRWQLVKGVTQMLLKGAEMKVNAQPSPLVEQDDEQPIVPAPGQITKGVFESMELIVRDMAWSPSDYLHFSSRYPNYLVAKEDPTVELSNMLEQWAQLALDEIALREGEDDNIELSGYEGSNDNDIGPQAPPVQSIEREDVRMEEAEELQAANLSDKPTTTLGKESKPGEELESASTQTESFAQGSVEQQSKSIGVQKSGESDAVTIEGVAHDPDETLPADRVSQAEASTVSGSHAAMLASDGHESASGVKASTLEPDAEKQLSTEDHTRIADISSKIDSSGAAANTEEVLEKSH